MKAFGVVRVSKKDQASEDRFSIPAQEKAIQDYCAQESIELAQLFVEPGTSAFTADIRRIPGLREALERIEAGEADALIVHESSRLARTERLTNEIEDRLEASGAAFIDVSMGGFDFSTPEGRMVLTQTAGLNSYWSRKVSQHSKKGKQQQFEEGLHVGAIPFGYTHALDASGATTRKLPMVIVPDEAEAIRKGYEEFALGKNAHEVAREWNAAGLVPRSVKGLTYFQPQTVRDILRNRLYAGWIQHLGEWRQGRHEAIISDEQFWAAQRERSSVHRRVHPPRLLRGVAKCPEGHRLYVLSVRHSPKDSYRKHYYYREPSPDFERPCLQTGLLWNANEVDGQVEELLRTLALDSPWLTYIEDQARSAGGRDVAHERERLKAKLQRVQDEYLEGNLPKDRYSRMRQDCETELARLAAVAQPLTVAATRLTGWWDLWEQASPEAKNETCRLVFDSAVVDFVRRDLQLHPHPEFLPLFDARVTYVGQTRPGRG